MDSQINQTPSSFRSSSIFFPLLIPALILVTIVGFLIVNHSDSPSPQAACTQEAKLCPDGSSVGRTGPNCQFAACPNGPNQGQVDLPSGGKVVAIPTVDPTPTSTFSEDCCTRSQLKSGYQCVADCGSPIQKQSAKQTYRCLSPEEAKNRTHFGCPICMASNTLISTPTGGKKIQDIKTGDLVWSTDKKGKKVSVPVSQIFTAKVPPTHTVFHLVLSDKREVWMSPNHPLVNNKSIGQLKVGSYYDNAQVKKLDLIPYEDSQTYDILPDSDTGFYWANKVLVGSTLKYMNLY